MLLFALRSQHRPDFVTLAVLTVKHHIGAILLRAEVGGIDDQPLPTTLHIQNDLRDRSVRDSPEGGPNATLLRVD